MLLDKKSLAIIKGASREPSRFAINGLKIEPDGSTVATDGMMVAVLSPVVGFDEKEHPAKAVPIKEGVILDADYVGEISKLIPGSKATHGIPILEHAALTQCDKEVEFTVTDGNRTRKVSEQPVEGKFPQYKDLLRPIYHEDHVTVVISATMLKRIAEIALSTACSDESRRGLELHIPTREYAPIMFRARDAENRCLVGAVMPMKIRGDEREEFTEWEKEALGAPKKLAPKPKAEKKAKAKPKKKK